MTPMEARMPSISRLHPPGLERCRHPESLECSKSPVGAVMAIRVLESMNREGRQGEKHHREEPDQQIVFLHDQHAPGSSTAHPVAGNQAVDCVERRATIVMP